MARSKWNRVLTGIYLLVIFLGLAGLWAGVLPLFTDVDPCLSAQLAPQDVAAVAARYTAFRALADRRDYPAAYAFTSSAYQRAANLDQFKEDLIRVRGLWLEFPKMTAKSTIFICFNRAYLSINGYSRSIPYYATVWWVKQGGQWYVNGLDAFYD
jgi:hypothetical protein